MLDRVDLNADVGEGVGDDDGLLRVVTSANVACGFHAGDALTMRRVCALAAERGVIVGAQPSYRDRDGFGRRDVEIAYGDLRADLSEQVEALQEAASEAGTRVRYLKPHGALYNRAVWDDEHAAAVVDTAAEFGLHLLGLPGSRLVRLAGARGVRAYGEFFADRAYAPDHRLVPRTEPGALIADPDSVAARTREFAEHGTVTTTGNTALHVEAASICIHGDTPGAVGLARTVRTTLADLGVDVVAFA